MIPPLGVLEAEYDSASDLANGGHELLSFDLGTEQFMSLTGQVRGGI